MALTRRVVVMLMIMTKQVASFPNCIVEHPLPGALGMTWRLPESCSKTIVILPIASIFIGYVLLG